MRGKIKKIRRTKINISINNQLKISHCLISLLHLFNNLKIKKL
jgi:hypothetical protein